MVAGGLEPNCGSFVGWLRTTFTAVLFRLTMEAIFAGCLKPSTLFPNSEKRPRHRVAVFHGIWPNPLNA